MLETKHISQSIVERKMHMFAGKVKNLALLPLCCILFAMPAKANTVNFYLQDIDDLEISGFQLFFVEPDFPLDLNNLTYESDFSYDWGSDQDDNKPIAWYLESLIHSDGDLDYARGIGATAPNINNTDLQLQEGWVLTMTSINTDFAIDIENLSNRFFDFTPPNGEPIELIISESWSNGDQTVIASAVPIPSSILLLGGGLIGFIVCRYKRKKLRN